MTIAITLKVNDGLVLAADSASTIVVTDELGNAGVINVYNNANKIFNLIKGRPIGAITWGGGNIGAASITTLMKDFRQMLTGARPAPVGSQWQPSATATVEQVAELAKRFFFDHLYQTAYQDAHKPPQIGFVIAGYSDQEGMADEYELQILSAQECIGPRLIRRREESGFNWYGQIEPITRLVLGYSSDLVKILVEDLNVPHEQLEPIILLLQQKLSAPLVSPAMPIQDAIDLAEFLVDLAINYARFIPGAPTVGGPIEIAAITKHEGFKWVRRKHYYDRDLNPKGA